MDVKKCVLEFLLANSPAGRAHVGQIADDDPLLSLGWLDSLTLYTLIVHLEKTFGIVVRDQELHPGNFGTIALITEFTEAKILALSA